MTRNRTILLGSLVLIAILLSLHSLGAELRRPAAGSDGAIATGSTFARSARPSPARSDEVAGLTAGVRLTYKAEFATSLDFPDAKEPRGMTISGRGTLELTCVEDAQDIVLHGVLNDPKLALTSASSDGALQADTLRHLSRPFGVVLDRSYRVTRLHVARDIDPLAQGILRYLVATWQFARPDDLPDGAASWSMDESDSSGVYTALYERVADGSFEKRKRDYRETAVALNPLGGSAEIDARASYRVRLAARIVESVHAEDNIRSRVGKNTLVSQAQSSLVLARADRVSPPDDPLAGLVPSALHRFVEPPPAAPPRLPADVTFDGLLAEVLAQPEPSATSAHGKLEQLFAERPETIAAALEALRRRRDLTPEARTALVAALGEAGTPEAQSALLEISRDGQIERPARQTALVRLGLLEQPTPETLTGLHELAAEPQGADRELATLMLGAAAKHELQAGGERSAPAEAGLAFLQQRLKDAHEPTEKSLYLEALGNTRSADTLPAAAQGLAADSPGVRGSAVNALRHVPGPEVDALVAATARNDPDHEVRYRAVDAMRYRELTATMEETLTAVLRSDEHELVRTEALTVLTSRGEESPAVRAQLEWTAEHDPSEELRKEARRLLDAQSDS